MKKSLFSGLTTLSLIFGFSASAEAAIISNPQSTVPHTVDGFFTDYGSGLEEWSDIDPQAGRYSYVYVDYDGTNMYIMNDWFVNTEGAASTSYNLFNFTTNTDFYEMKVYGDGHVVFASLSPEPAFSGKYSYGVSPNVSTPHAMWEISISMPSGEVIANLSDPKTGSPTDSLYSDPDFQNGLKVTLNSGGGTSSEPVPEPSAMIMLCSGLAAFSGLRAKKRVCIDGD